MLEKGLFAFVSTRVEPAGGMWPLVRQQDATYPTATYTRVSGPRMYAMNKQVKAEATFDIKCYGQTYLEAKTLAEEMRKAMSSYLGDMGDVTVDQVYVMNELDHYEEDTKVYVCLMEIQVIYHEESEY